MTGKLWVFSELYWPEETSTGHFLTALAEGLADEFETHVVSGQPTYSERGLRAAVRETRGGVTINRVRSTTFDKNVLPLRAVNMVTFTLSTLLFAWRHLRPGDRVLAVTNPPLIPTVVGWLAQRRGAHSVLLVHDVYPEVLSATGSLSADGWLHRAIGRIMSWTYRRFDRVVVLGDDMARLVTRKGVDTERIRVVRNWADLDEVAPIARVENPFVQRHGLDGRTIVQFSGNIGRSHDVGTILAVAERLRHRDDIVFLFVGQGGRYKLVQDAIAASDLTNVRLLPRQPRKDLPAMLNSSDATIIALEKPMVGISVPSRMYNVLAAGVPIIAMADEESELSRTVVRHGAGWVVEPGDTAQLAAVVEGLVLNAGDARARGRAGREAALNSYGLSQSLAGFRSILTDASLEED